MKKKTFSYVAFAIVLLLVLSACGSLPAFSLSQLSQKAQSVNTAVAAQPVVDQLQQAATATPVATQDTSSTTSSTAQQPVAPVTGASNSLLAAYEGTLENIYTQVGPSVVNIHVVEGASTSSNSQTSPFGLPFGNNTPSQGTSEALGSGFIWDTQGHIITNNHVVSGATSVDVTFSDGTNVPAKVVGTDPNSDLAVIQVQANAALLKPVTLGDSKSLKVGQLVIAIGNPYGLQGTMTTGIVSALGRSISASDGNSTTTSGYSIPDIIQTDAAINPGNSGGVLLDQQGQVIGVTAAIESSTNSNSGIGFAIPSATVKNEVPALIQTGKFDHPYLGISGQDMTPDLATAMKLPTTTRGALVIDVVPGGPSAKAGLKGSATQTQINGTTTNVGGDVITAIDGQAIKRMDDLIAYLNDNTKVGQKISVTILRNGQQQNVDVTLEARPATTATTGSVVPNNGGQQQNGQAYLGVQGVDVNAAIIQAMSLPSNTQGVLVEKVDSGGPAEAAGVQGGTKTSSIGGQNITIGGDVIVAISGQPITGVSDLQTALSQLQPGQRIRLTLIRNGQSGTVRVTLGTAPAQTQQ